MLRYEIVEEASEGGLFRGPTHGVNEFFRRSPNRRSVRSTYNECLAFLNHRINISSTGFTPPTRRYV
ncbi:hypothetical protein AB1N83_005475 [Pleurotus pulmonarius]